jgi:hypothetical protein
MNISNSCKLAIFGGLFSTLFIPITVLFIILAIVFIIQRKRRKIAIFGIILLILIYLIGFGSLFIAGLPYCRLE